MDKVYAAHVWMAKHEEELERFAGKWVAVSGAGIEASSESFKLLVKDKAVKLTDMLITRVPTPEQVKAVWSL